MLKVRRSCRSRQVIVRVGDCAAAWWSSPEGGDQASGRVFRIVLGVARIEIVLFFHLCHSTFLRIGGRAAPVVHALAWIPDTRTAHTPVQAPAPTCPLPPRRRRHHSEQPRRHRRHCCSHQHPHHRVAQHLHAWGKQRPATRHGIHTHIHTHTTIRPCYHTFTKQGRKGGHSRGESMATGTRRVGPPRRTHQHQLGLRCPLCACPCHHHWHTHGSRSGHTPLTCRSPACGTAHDRCMSS